MNLQSKNLEGTVFETIKLVSGEFSAPEASELITLLINQKINFHRLHELQSWEKNNNFDNSEITERIENLQDQKLLLQKFISENENSSKRFAINGELKITAQK